MSTPPLQQLQAFLVVARLLNFTSAARELRVSPSAVSQAVKQLERHLRVALLNRTTRSVALTEAGRRLVENAAPGLEQALAALEVASAVPGELAGRLRLTVPRAAVPFVIEPVLPVFRERYPRVEVEVDVDNRFVDIVTDGFDAGVRLSESIQKDMVQLRLTDAFRFVVAGAPSYFAKHGIPERPEDLLRHECITHREPSTGALYAWELERGRRKWRVAVNAAVVTGERTLSVALAERGLGLVYIMEPMVSESLRAARLKVVLDAYAAEVPGFFLYFPSRAQRSPVLRAFIELAKELAVREL
jgi:DNA-binding transcriptional LysR family regulator